jgi:hypothetical protein
LAKRKYIRKPMATFVPAEPNMDVKSKQFYADQMRTNPLYQEIINNIHTEFISGILSSHADNEKLRNELYWGCRVLKKIDDTFRRYIADATFDKQMEQMKDLQTEQVEV